MTTVKFRAFKKYYVRMIAYNLIKLLTLFCGTNCYHWISSQKLDDVIRRIRAI